MVFAIPAKPGKFAYKQPDGSVVMVENHGDEHGHWMTNEAGEAVINFGKHKGKTARQVWRTEPSYFAWIQQGSFTLDTKKQFEKLEEQFKLERLAEKFKRN